ncbi:ABC transporter permease [Natronosporangium hydrolyticum]|uniref:ABC transporter permease n=1 Tax=Natronosporangium hydrolyticum TaxID=2811111 RepID=A0A895Y8C6_9ACTN|nr:ABC transporter permease [Natronosporangium hydrolyticum]QSB13974.1 ABC transporter permease [Natronosporangium hydrolyticum]
MRTDERAGRLLPAYLLTIFVLVTLNFALPRAMPGDPITAAYTEGSTSYVHDEAIRERLRAHYGLDQPLPVQYGQYLTGLLRGDLGTSIRYGVPVTELLTTRAPRTGLLVSTALVAGTLLGVAAGAAAGWRRGRRVDHALLAGFTLLRSIPVFVLGSLLLLVFAVRLGWFPIAGASTPFASLGPVARTVDIAHHLALPATVLALQFAAGQFLVMRAGMVSELGADYLLAGRARGLRERTLRYRYAGRNALLPVVSVLAVQVGTAVTATILVETVFRYEGVGRLVFDAIRFRDYPTLQGCFLLLTLSVVTANALAELAYRRLDPRVAAA